MKVKRFPLKCVGNTLLGSSFLTPPQWFQAHQPSTELFNKQVERQEGSFGSKRCQDEAATTIYHHFNLIYIYVCCMLGFKKKHRKSNRKPLVCLFSLGTIFEGAPQLPLHHQTASVSQEWQACRPRDNELKSPPGNMAPEPSRALAASKCKHHRISFLL